MAEALPAAKARDGMRGLASCGMAKGRNLHKRRHHLCMRQWAERPGESAHWSLLEVVSGPLAVGGLLSSRVWVV